MTAFIVLSVVAALAAAALVAAPLLRSAEQPAPIAAVVAALLLPAAAALIYFSASNYGWQPARSMTPAAANSDSAAAPDLNDAVRGLQDRLSREPEDRDGWLLLGNAMLQLQRPDQAEQAFRTALELSGGQDPNAKLGIAEAQILLDRASLAGAAGALIEEVLTAQPDNGKALFYGGLAAAARDEPGLLQSRWQRLLALDPPEQVRRIVTEQLSAMGISVESSPAADPAGPPGRAIEVRVALADALVDKVAKDAVLFLVARDGDAPGPPVAAVRVSASTLPQTLQLSDANAMIPGRSLGNVADVRLIARVSNGGDALAQPGDVYGEARWSDGDGPVTIVMNQIVQP